MAAPVIRIALLAEAAGSLLLLRFVRSSIRAPRAPPKRAFLAGQRAGALTATLPPLPDCGGPDGAETPPVPQA